MRVSCRQLNQFPHINGPIILMISRLPAGAIYQHVSYRHRELPELWYLCVWMCENRGCSTKEEQCTLSCALLRESDSFSVLPPSAHMGLLIWFPTMTCDWLPNWTRHVNAQYPRLPLQRVRMGVYYSQMVMTSGQVCLLVGPIEDKSMLIYFTVPDTVLSVWFLQKLVECIPIAYNEGTHWLMQISRAFLMSFIDWKRDCFEYKYTYLYF